MSAARTPRKLCRGHQRANVELPEWLILTLIGITLSVGGIWRAADGRERHGRRAHPTRKRVKTRPQR